MLGVIWIIMTLAKVCFVPSGVGNGEIAITLRDAFVPPKGCYLLTADYSQLELRYVTTLSTRIGKHSLPFQLNGAFLKRYPPLEHVKGWR